VVLASSVEDKLGVRRMAGTDLGVVTGRVGKDLADTNSIVVAGRVDRDTVGTQYLAIDRGGCKTDATQGDTVLYLVLYKCLRLPKSELVEYNFSFLLSLDRTGTVTRGTTATDFAGNG
jgi:hypothetical protein